MNNIIKIVVYVLIHFLSYLPLYAADYPFQKAVLLLPSNNTLNRDINSKIGYMFTEMINKELDRSSRIKMLHYFAQTPFHNFFNMIYQPDEKIADSIACSLFRIPQDQLLINHRTALYKGDFLAPDEYSSQDIKEKILFLKYQKAITSLVYRPVIQYAYHQNQKEIELRISEILKANEEKTELNIKKLLDSHGNEKLKSIILGVDFGGPCDELSPTIRDLLLRTSFSIEDTTILLNFSVIVTAYESGENKGLFLNKLLKNFIDKHQRKSIDDKCRFILIFTILLHHRYLPKAYRTNYINSLFDNVNDFFPTTIKPTQSHVSYIDDLHGTEYEPTLLHYACKFALKDLINFILAKDNISISLNKQNHEGKTPLMLLCKHYFSHEFYGNEYTNSDISEKIIIFSHIVTQCIAKGANLAIKDNERKSIFDHILENIDDKSVGNKMVATLKKKNSYSTCNYLNNAYLALKIISTKYFTILLKLLNIHLFFHC